MPHTLLNLPRKVLLSAAMTAGTGCARSAEGQANWILKGHPSDHLDGGEPAAGRLAHLAVKIKIAPGRPTCGRDGWGSDFKKPKSSKPSKTAATFAASSSSPSASANPPNTWPTSGQAGNGTSCRCEPGATGATAPIATSTGCLRSSASISAIGASFPSTSRATRGWRDTGRLPMRAARLTARCRRIAKGTAGPSLAPIGSIASIGSLAPIERPGRGVVA